MRDDSPRTARMLPELTEDNRAYWTGGADGQLLIARCTQCHRWTHPPAADCPDCGGALAAQPVSGLGTVFTFTVNHQAFNPAVPLPYVIAIVQLSEQADLRVAANIVDCEPESVYIGLPVAARFERDDTDPTVFVPTFAPRQDADLSGLAATPSTN